MKGMITRMSKDLWKPNKDRFIATLRGETPDRVPYFEMLIESRIVKHILKRDVGSTMAASRGASERDIKVPPPMDANDYLEVVDYIGQDTLLLDALWAPIKYADEKGDFHAIQTGFVKDWSDLDKLILPTWEDDIEPRKKYLEEYVKAAKTKNVAVSYLVGSFFQYCYQYLIGFEDCCLMVYEDKPLLERCFDITLDYYLKMTDIAIEAGIDVLIPGDDVAYRTGTFIKPDMFEEIWLGRMQKIVRKGREAGLPIMFHSCGNLTGIMDSIICKLDIDCLHPIEPYSMDIYDIKQKYHDHFCVAGNMDIAGPLAFGTPKETYDEAVKMIETLKVGGKYIFCSNHSITNDIPPENFDAMLQALKDVGAY